MSIWTKGPLRIKCDSQGADVTGPHGAFVAWFGCGSVSGIDGSYSVSPAEAHANAQLFDAAPDLVDALKIAREYMAMGVALSFDLAQVDAALKKAGAA